MAVTKIWAVRSRLDHLVDYVSNIDKMENPNFKDLKSVIDYAGANSKTEKRFFATGINCQPETAYKAMTNSLKLNDKKIRVLGYHAYQSFAKGEVTAKTAHEIGVKMAQELWGDKFQVVVATHLNTEHFHNHFVLCFTSFIDGKRFHACKESYSKMREVSDRLCKEYSLSVIENPERGKSKHYAEWQAEKNGEPTYRSMMKADVDAAIRESMTERQFFANLRKKGYEIKQGQDITLRYIGRKKGLKLKRNFGDYYSIESIRERILAQDRPERSIIPAKPPPKKMQLRGSLSKKRMTGLKARYFYYLYRLGVFPKKRQYIPNPNRVYFLFREDIRHIQNISRETRLLVKHDIETDEQLLKYKNDLTNQINLIYEQRRELRNQMRTVEHINNPDVFKQKISDLSEKLKELRREKVHCENIEKRSVDIAFKLQQERENEKMKNKEVTINDQFRRRR